MPGGRWKDNRPKYHPCDDPSKYGYGNHYIAGEGPQPADVMLIGSGPGVTEDQLRRVFVGGTGRLLDRLLEGEGLCRDEIFVTNVVKHHVPDDKDPPARDILRDAQDLQEEVTGANPRIIGLMGAVAVHAFLPGVSLEWGHGLVFRVDDPDGVGEAGYLMPMYHPAFAFHSPDNMVKIRADFHNLKRLIRGTMTVEELAGAHDQFPHPRYEELTDHDCSFIAQVFATRTDHNWCAIDTEGYYYAPWGLSFSIQEGEAFVITNKSKKALKYFEKILKASGRVTVLHNSLHDLEVLSALGVEVGAFIDTMVNAYHLCVEPQGLKPLMMRYRGAQQMDYDEVMGPAIRRLSVGYLDKVRAWANKTYAKESKASTKAQLKLPLQRKTSTGRRAGKK